MTTQMKKCRGCHEMVAKVNRKGYCRECAIDKALQAAIQLKRKRGYYYDKWLKAMRRKFGPKAGKEG